MSTDAPDYCAVCGELSDGILRDLCPGCREFPLENPPRREIVAERLPIEKSKPKGEKK